MPISFPLVLVTITVLVVITVITVITVLAVITVITVLVVITVITVITVIAVSIAVSIAIGDAPSLWPMRAPLQRPQVLLVVLQQHPYNLSVETPLTFLVLLVASNLNDDKTSLAYPNLLPELCRQDDQCVVTVWQHDIHLIAPARPSRLTYELIRAGGIGERLERTLNRDARAQS